MLFENPVPKTTEQQVVERIDGLLKRAAQVQLFTYRQIRDLIYEHESLEADAVYSAFAARTTSGMTVEQLGESAKIAKSTLNRFQPGLIVDEVPEATITF